MCRLRRRGTGAGQKLGDNAETPVRHQDSSCSTRDDRRAVVGRWRSRDVSSSGKGAVVFGRAMKTVCIVVQNYYDIDIRVRRKAEALVAAGYEVDVLALRATADGPASYVLSGVQVYTVDLGKQRGSLVRYVFEY